VTQSSRAGVGDRHSSHLAVQLCVRRSLVQTLEMPAHIRGRAFTVFSRTDFNLKYYAKIVETCRHDVVHLQPCMLFTVIVIDRRRNRPDKGDLNRAAAAT
jgi:hypothetical protein